MKKFSVAAAALAMFLTLALIPATAEAQPARWAGTAWMPEDPLNLTPEQEEKIEDLWIARMDKMTAFQDQMMKLQLEMNTLMRDPKADAKKIEGLIDRMSALRAEHQKEALRHRQSVESVLTPEQLATLQTFRGRFAGRGLMPGRGGVGMGRMPGMRGTGGGYCLLGLGTWDGYRGRGFMDRSFGRGMQDRGRRPARGMWRRW
jgi:Spy/CpxP family protein refolding chaperone